MISGTSKNIKKLLQKIKQDLLSALEMKYGECDNDTSFKDLHPEVVEGFEHALNSIAGLVNNLEIDVDSLKTQLDLKDREIEQALITDNLTKLYNRHHMVNVLEREMARCQRYNHPLALMMIDIDDFRSFNESYGQGMGDKMLLFSGNLIRENIRKFDRAFRYGGKEFIVVMPETDLTMAFIAAERIRKSFQNRLFSVVNKKSSKEEKASRTLSTGITYSFAYDTEAIQIDKLIEQTDKAVSMAKHKGGNVSLTYEEQENPSSLN